MEDLTLPPKIEPSSPHNHRVIALILFAFLVTFVCSRILVYAIIEGYLPNLFLYIRGVHIHHFTYGVFITAFVGIYLLLKRPQTNTLSFRIVTSLYGVGLGLTFDEFGMWIHLRDDYWIRHSYDAVITITLLLFNLIYGRHLIRAIAEIARVTSYPIRQIFRSKTKSL